MELETQDITGAGAAPELPEVVAHCRLRFVNEVCDRAGKHVSVALPVALRTGLGRNATCRITHPRVSRVQVTVRVCPDIVPAHEGVEVTNVGVHDIAVESREGVWVSLEPGISLGLAIGKRIALDHGQHRRAGCVWRYCFGS